MPNRYRRRRHVHRLRAREPDNRRADPLQGAERAGGSFDVGPPRPAAPDREGGRRSQRRRAGRPRDDASGQRDHPRSGRQGRARGLARPPRYPRDRARAPRQLVQLHDPERKTAGHPRPDLRDPGPRPRRRRDHRPPGAGRDRGHRRGLQGPRHRRGHRALAPLLRPPRDGATGGRGAAPPPSRRAGHRFGARVARAARIRALAGGDHERLRPAADGRLPGASGGPGCRGGRGRAHLHNRQ